MWPVPRHRNSRGLHDLFGVSLDALTLWERGAFGYAIAYVAASVLFSLAAVTAGFRYHATSSRNAAGGSFRENRARDRGAARTSP